jgi:hypothetical protein
LPIILPSSLRKRPTRTSSKFYPDGLSTGFPNRSSNRNRNRNRNHGYQSHIRHQGWHRLARRNPHAGVQRRHRTRVAKRLALLPHSDKILSGTFGLAVIGQATFGAKPYPTGWLEGRQDLAKVVSQMDQLARTDIKFKLNLMLVRTVFSTLSMPRRRRS